MNIDKIRAGAEAATPGPYRATQRGKQVLIVVSDVKIACVSRTNIDARANAAHIANCDPQTILKMITLIDAANEYFREYKGHQSKTVCDAFKALEAP